MKDIQTIITDFCTENKLSIRLSYRMPAGYETAFGTYDVTVNTLFLNRAALSNAPEYEVLFYLFHELRHAMQYRCPQLFDRQIRKSLPYVVLYNGCCYRLKENVWHEVTLDGAENYFTQAYLSLPYEWDANAFAHEQVKALCGDTAELRALYDFWTPRCKLGDSEMEKLFLRIDNALKEKGRMD